MKSKGIYVDKFEGKRVDCESDLYAKIFAGRHFKEMQKEAERLGMSAMATDERLAFFVGAKTGFIQD